LGLYIRSVWFLVCFAWIVGFWRSQFSSVLSPCSFGVRNRARWVLGGVVYTVVPFYNRVRQIEGTMGLQEPWTYCWLWLFCNILVSEVEE
jgi:hypothetical protein